MRVQNSGRYSGFGRMEDETLFECYGKSKTENEAFWLLINVWIDELTPCLRDAETNELVDTEVLRIKRKSFLQKYSKKNGWYVNWADLVESYEVYALVLEGTIDIQGLVAVKRDVERGATYIAWMCASPENNKQIRENVRFNGVGGHLFAIAIQKSVDYEQQGAVYG